MKYDRQFLNLICIEDDILYDCYEMTNIFDILNSDYQIVDGVGKNGGYHKLILLSSLFSDVYVDEV